MIASTLKTILTASGCTLVLYEASQLMNLLTDQSDQDDIIGLVLEPNEIILEVKGNGVSEHYLPHTVEILQQVDLESLAEDNEAKLDNLLEIAKAFIMAVIASGSFKKVESIIASKVLQSKYDANVIGWSLPMNLFLLENVNNC